MKSNLFKRSLKPEFIALASAESLLFGDCQLPDGHIRFSRDLSSASKAFTIADKNPTKSVNLALILADDLLLYRQLEFPPDLPESELADLIALELKRQASGSSVQIYSDYFKLAGSSHVTHVGLFEVRKDKLDGVIAPLAAHGFATVLVVPQMLILINQALLAYQQFHEEFCLLIYRAGLITVVSIRQSAIEDISKAQLNCRQADPQFSSELIDLLAAVDSKMFVLAGLDEARLSELTAACQSLASQSVSGVSELDRQSIAWMREHYDCYQSVTLA